MEPSICIFSLVPANCFAVIDPGTSRSLINSVAASVFPSDCCNKDNKRTRPRKVLSHYYLKPLVCTVPSYVKDTTDFLNKLANLNTINTLPDNAILVTLKDPVLPIKHCTLQSPGGHFCDVENSEAFVFGQNSTL